MRLENDIINIQEDIDTTLDTLLTSTTDQLSQTFFTKINTLDTINIERSKEKKVLSDILNEKETEQLNKELFTLFSPDTQTFILNYLSHGAQGDLEITIDDTLKNGPQSKKGFDVIIRGKDSDNKELYHDAVFTSIANIEKICDELSNLHYLGLGLEGGVLQSITFHKPQWKNIKRTNTSSDEETESKRMIKKTITTIYPIKKNK